MLNGDVLHARAITEPSNNIHIHILQNASGCDNVRITFSKFK
jgi:hypothetical protein